MMDVSMPNATLCFLLWRINNPKATEKLLLA